ncbi:hypothetical protein HYS97_00980 [Candidatus Daviesbacteria bacterium]|nr:hypothetical protein [Candidatus Daviesbacteria bacterium]
MPIGSDKTPPVSEDPKKAEKYVNMLISLLKDDKASVRHTDLSQFDPTSLQDHYWMDLKDFQVEVSHSKNYQTGEDSYVIIFNNLKHVEGGNTEKVILSYIHLNSNQFIRFKNTADEQLNQTRKEKEEARFDSAMAPIENKLEELTNQNSEPETQYDNSISGSDSTSQNGYHEADSQHKIFSLVES